MSLSAKTKFKIFLTIGSVSLILFGLSLIAHLSTFWNIDHTDLFPFIWLFHFGFFVLFIPYVFIMKSEETEDVETALQKKASENGKTITTYIEDLLRQQASKSSLDEILAPLRKNFEDSGIS